MRPVFAALGAGIAMSGSLLGPILFFVLFNLRLLTRYYGVAYGYRKGWTSSTTWAAASCKTDGRERPFSACLLWAPWSASGRT